MAGISVSQEQIFGIPVGADQVSYSTVSLGETLIGSTNTTAFVKGGIVYDQITVDLKGVEITSFLPTFSFGGRTWTVISELPKTTVTVESITVSTGYEVRAIDFNNIRVNL